MIHETIELWVPYDRVGVSAEGCKATLTCYVNPAFEQEKKTGRPAVLICPGGGYEYCSDREAEPIALAFAAAGIPAFVLRYSVVKKQFPTALLEAACAMEYIRLHSREWYIRDNAVYIAGFSAGGHLAASLCVHWNKSWLYEAFGQDTEIRPDGAILSYPVITTGKLTHQGSIENLTALGAEPDLLKLLTLEQQVLPDTPATFLWHCADDGCVPVENSLRYAAALSKEKVPFELHIFPKGGHGASLANETTADEVGQIVPEIEGWLSLAITWLKNREKEWTKNMECWLGW